MNAKKNCDFFDISCKLPSILMSVSYWQKVSKGVNVSAASSWQICTFRNTYSRPLKTFGIYASLLLNTVNPKVAVSGYLLIDTWVWVNCDVESSISTILLNHQTVSESSCLLCQAVDHLYPHYCRPSKAVLFIVHEFENSTSLTIHILKQYENNYGIW